MEKLCRNHEGGTIAEYNAFLSEYWGRDKETDKLMAERNQDASSNHGGCL